MVKLTPVQTNHVVATASRLHINSRETFFRAVNRILSTRCPIPISNNDVMTACDLAMECIPSSEILITRSVGPTGDDEFEFDCRRRY